MHNLLPMMKKSDRENFQRAAKERERELIIVRG